MRARNIPSNRTRELAKPVHAFAGQVDASIPSAVANSALYLHLFTPPGTPISEALRDVRINLETAVRRAFPRARA